MHIEPGILNADTLLFANTAIVGVLGAHARAWLRRPALWSRTVLAATFFTLCMQAFHMNVGPSELHFVGAMPIYMLCGYLPTLFGFALGLAMQGLLFEPQDLVHLAVNSLSLIVPLMVTHHALGKFVRGADVRSILRLDAAYYSGVTLMVGFWLLNAQRPTPLADWAAFAVSYVGLVVLEPALTWTLVRGVQAAQRNAASWVTLCFDERVARRT